MQRSGWWGRYRDAWERQVKFDAVGRLARDAS
jgi:hypothetical protein